MAHLDVVQAVEARLAANFNHCPIIVENENTPPPSDGSAFLHLQFPWSRAEWETVNGPDGCAFLEEGAFRLVLAVDRGTGSHTGREWLDALAAVFRSVAFEGVQCFAPTSPITDDRSDAGSYYRLAITVPYEFIIHQ